ncbi:hypothetical protein [Prochlorococcus sp. MIT 1307]|uniref:hypothetical protein n=1 Tax=Prochlorococcus sp. MIT 1307 TaxID=3096219 RepID=UPI002A75A80A|nr:hypothetical protein [Prochlorococcus sp. MIT 1307]
MKSPNRRKEIAETIEFASPLYAYWKSSQNTAQENERLKKSSATFPAAGLFKKEPYKWEMLYQSIAREVVKGDLSAIKGLKLLIKMLNTEEQYKIIQTFSNKELFSEDIISELQNSEQSQEATKKNIIRFIRILLAIFTNPYCIEIKREKSHIYEHTGSAIQKLRKLVTRRNAIKKSHNGTIVTK